MSFNISRLSHAYITDASFADTLAMAVVCGARDSAGSCKRCIHCDKALRNIHPDIIEIARIDGKLIISVDQIRAIKQDAYILPNEAMQKVYIIKDADSMNTNAQNAFLQILEEPPPHVVFVLCADNPAALLPTVRSRCVELKSFSRDDGGSYGSDVDGDDSRDDSADDDIELNELARDFVEALSGNNIKLMECMFRIDKLDRYAFQNFLSLARERLVLTLRESSRNKDLNIYEKLIHADSVLIKAGEMLELNVSAGHIAGFICASMVEV